MVGEGGRGQVIKSLACYAEGPELDFRDGGRFNASQQMFLVLSVLRMSFTMDSEVSTDFLEEENGTFALCQGAQPDIQEVVSGAKAIMG